MISIVYSATTSRDVQRNLGSAEYSYYFVLKEFSEVFKSFGPVIVVTDPAREVDPIFHESAARGEDCIFFSFTPPHMTTLGLACPTIPVVAWEFDTMPNETWFGERQQDWRYVLDRMGRAITLSSASAQTMKDAMGSDFPVISIPAPVWDRFAAKSEGGAISTAMQIDVAGIVIDSGTADLSRFLSGSEHAKSDLLGLSGRTHRIQLDGVIYLAVFNPDDERKNWRDVIAGFCHGLRDVADATLVLKLADRGSYQRVINVMEWVHKFAPFRCRVLLLSGFLETEQYDALVRATSYIVNASHGEGQCLPLMEGMASGKPAIAPRHSALADYIDTPQAFVVRSSAEPNIWPCDPRWAFRALCNRIDFDSLIGAYRQSYAVAKDDPARYRHMSQQAREAIRLQASMSVTRERLEALLRMPARPPGPIDQYGQIKERPAAYWTAEFGTVG